MTLRMILQITNNIRINSTLLKYYFVVVLLELCIRVNCFLNVRQRKGKRENYLLHVGGICLTCERNLIRLIKKLSEQVPSFSQEIKSRNHDFNGFRSAG